MSDPNVTTVEQPVELVAVNTREVPKSLRDNFKAVCAQQGMTMQEAVIEFMDNFVLRHSRERRATSHSA